MFKNRTDAGLQLAEKLAQYRTKDAVVLALPRGGVVSGYEVARALDLPLDIVVVRKVGHPSNPEYAIGAVDDAGLHLCNESEAAAVDKEWLEQEMGIQRREAERRVILYRGKKNPLEVKGKTAIIVDDGIATGLTMRLAIRSVKAQGAKRILVAVPVAPPESIRTLEEEGADEIILLEPPEDFLGSVSAHYQEFEQVEDDEVVRLMRAI